MLSTEEQDGAGSPDFAGEDPVVLTRAEKLPVAVPIEPDGVGLRPVRDMEATAVASAGDAETAKSRPS